MSLAVTNLYGLNIAGFRAPSQADVDLITRHLWPRGFNDLHHIQNALSDWKARLDAGAVTLDVIVAALSEASKHTDNAPRVIADANLLIAALYCQ